MVSARVLLMFSLACLEAVCASSLRHGALLSDGITATQKDRWVAGSNIPVIKSGKHRRQKIKGVAFWKRIQKLELFVDPLISPAVIDFTTGQSAGKTGKLTMGAFKTKWTFHRDLPPSPVYAYGTSRRTASVPGPTIVVASNQTLHVQWRNEIRDARHMFPVDHTVGAPLGVGVPMVPHLHGGFSESSSDGHPDAWFTASGRRGKTFVKTNYTYFNVQPAAMLWYHDHTMGMTRLNVQAGLFGAYIIKDASFEDPLQLPSGAYDIPLVFHDLSFRAGGSIYVPYVGDNPMIHPHWVPEEFGEFVSVNGKVSPHLEVEARKYRFRLLNSCLARFLTLSLPLSSSSSSPSLLNFTQITADGSYLVAPHTISQYLIAPGERGAIVVDFSLLPVGSNITLTNSAPAPFPDGDPVTAFTSQVLQFRVKAVTAPDTSRVPAAMLSLGPADPTKAVNYPDGRAIMLTETASEQTGNPEHALIEGKQWNEPVSILPRFGDVEIWTIINLTGDTHPMHVHLVPHRVLYRREINSTLYAAGECSVNGGMDATPPADSCFTGPLEVAGPDEWGYSDTTLAHPSYVTALLLDFNAWLPAAEGGMPFDPTVGPGYVLHCHILDHEDNDMMRPFKLHS